MKSPLFPQSVHEYHIAKMRDLADAYDAKLDSIKSRADAEKHRKMVKRKLRKCFGKMPKKTPLNVQTTGIFTRKGYTVENLIYESRPGYYVTANLYTPDGDGEKPAVLIACGHSPNGKAGKTYQAVARGLALRGFTTLIYDPPSQGERSNQYGQNKPCTTEHTTAGNHMTLAGDFFGSWRVWDGIRSLDVLLSQPNIDKTRVGVTGCSGGGTLTTYLNVMDDRFTMAAPDCFVVTYLINMENELPADAEQMPPGILASGLDMADFFIAQAPRPTIFLGEYRDMFDIRGLTRTYERVSQFYHRLGAAENVELHFSDEVHGYWQAAREGCYEFFCKHAGIKASPAEKETPTEPDEKLFATRKGTVLDLPGAKKTCQFTAERAKATAKARSKVTANALPTLIGKTLKLDLKDVSVPHFRTLRAQGGKDIGAPKQQFIFPFGLETEPNFPQVMSVLFRCDSTGRDIRKALVQLPDSPRDVTLYLPHSSSYDDLAKNKTPKANKGLLYCLDTRGIGVMEPNSCGHGDFMETHGAEYFYSAHGQMLGEPMLGRRVHDTLAAIRLLETFDTKNIHLVGRGIGAVTAAMAGLLSSTVKQVTLENAPKSFLEIAEAEKYEWPLSVMPFDVLSSFDLPDVYAALKKKKLKNISPWTPMMKLARKK